jgi:hypothetical protein
LRCQTCVVGAFVTLAGHLEMSNVCGRAGWRRLKLVPYVLDQWGLLPEEGVKDDPASSLTYALEGILDLPYALSRAPERVVCRVHAIPVPPWMIVVVIEHMPQVVPRHCQLAA